MHKKATRFHITRGTYKPIWPTDQRSSTTSAEFQWKWIKSENKKEIQTMSQSSFLILDYWPGNGGVNS